MVTAYNSNSVDARNILSSTRQDDILVENMACIARVEVNSAFFTQSYVGPRGVAPPLMRMLGSVSSVFIEDDDDRVFPCNEKEIQIMSPESVMVDYMLTPSEIGVLAQKGIFHDPNFRVPANLVGNIIEIPLNITYKGIYDTPCCFIDIIQPMELMTSTPDNNYYGLFEACPASQIAKDIDTGKVRMVSYNEPRMSAPHMFEEYQPTVEEQQVEPEVSVEEQEDRKIMETVAKTVEDVAQDNDERRRSVDPRKVAERVLYPAQQDYKQQAESQQQQADNSFKLLDDNIGPKQPSPEVLSKYTNNIYDMLSTRAKAAETSTADDGEGEFGRTDEDIQDEQQEQVQDGLFGSGFLTDEDADSKDPHRRREAEAKKQREQARRLDVAMDNKALNESPDADISGFGASDAKPAKPAKPTGGAALARELLAKRIQSQRAAQAAQAAPAVAPAPSSPAVRQSPAPAPNDGQFL